MDPNDNKSINKPNSSKIPKKLSPITSAKSMKTQPKSTWAESVTSNIDTGMNTVNLEETSNLSTSKCSNSKNSANQTKNLGSSVKKENFKIKRSLSCSAEDMFENDMHALILEDLDQSLNPSLTQSTFMQPSKYKFNIIPQEIKNANKLAPKTSEKRPNDMKEDSEMNPFFDDEMKTLNESELNELSQTNYFQKINDWEENQKKKASKIHNVAKTGEKKILKDSAQIISNQNTAKQLNKNLNAPSKQANKKSQEEYIKKNDIAEKKKTTKNFNSNLNKIPEHKNNFNIEENISEYHSPTYDIIEKNTHNFPCFHSDQADYQVNAMVAAPTVQYNAYSKIEQDEKQVHKTKKTDFHKKDFSGNVNQINEKKVDLLKDIQTIKTYFERDLKPQNDKPNPKPTKNVMQIEKNEVKMNQVAVKNTVVKQNPALMKLLLD